MTWVKLCSIKSMTDIQIAIESKADAVGFLIGQRHTSNDFVTPERARQLARSLPETIEPIIVTHLTEPNDIFQIVKETDIFTVQLHGNCNTSQIVKLKNLLPRKCKIIFAFHVTEVTKPDRITIPPCIDMLLLDSCNKREGKVGGTGEVHDWDISKKIVEQSPIPVILAGGLTPENVQDAISKVNPYGVDVNSGVKSNTGFRSKERSVNFVKRAKSKQKKR